jgi:hypothetical protein
MGAELDGHIAAFAAAIEDEVAAEKVSDRTNRHILAEGTLISDSGDENFLYFFSTPYEINLPEEAMVQLEVDGRVVEGVYVGGDRDLVTVASSEFLGARVRGATMIATPWDLLVKLEERLNALKDATDTGKALPLLDPVPSAASLPELDGAFAASRWLDQSQRDALQKVAEHDVSFIWGPPGTGKTRTVAYLVRELIERGKSALLLAHSNAAVDVATLAVVNACRGTPDLSAGAMIRYGIITSRDLMAEPDVNPLSILARRNVDAERFVGLQSRRHDLLDHARREELFDAAAFETVRDDMGKLRHRVDKELKKLVADAPVVATTLTKLALSDELMGRSFDAVIVDEASMSLVPYDVLAASRAHGTVVFAGDFMQLPPIASGTTPAVRQWLQRDIYQVRGITGAVRAGEDVPEMAMLRTQYRMHPSIRAAVSRLFYQDRLDDGERVMVRTSSIARLGPFEGCAMAAVDTSLLQARCYREVRGYSRLNLVEAVTVLTIAAGMLSRYPGICIGIVTPYAIQARMLKTMARELALDRDRLTISTVHRYQGSEVDVILFSLTDGDPQWSMSTLTRGSLEDWDVDPAPRLLNVALSRARGKFILVGDLDFVHDRGTQDSVLRHIIGIIEQEGAVQRIDPRDIGRLRDWLPNRVIDDQRIVVGERSRHSGWLVERVRAARHTITAGVPHDARVSPLMAHMLSSAPSDCRLHYAEHDGLRAASARFGASESFAGDGVAESFIQVGSHPLLLEGTLEHGYRSLYLALDLPATDWFFLKNTGFVPESLLGKNPEAARGKGWRRRQATDMTAEDAAAGAARHAGMAPEEPGQPDLPLDGRNDGAVDAAGDGDARADS